MRKEQWKDVAGSPGYYVSSHGRVASQLRGPDSWRLLKACPNNVGYLSVKVPVNGDHKTAFVHRLVAFAFLPPQPTPKHEANHKDGNKLNNIPANLQWMTRRENQLHRFAVLGQYTGEGETAPNAKLTEAQARDVIARRKAGEKGAVIAADLGISTSVVYSIARGVTWKHLTTVRTPV
jgi:hypothetical protein